MFKTHKKNRNKHNDLTKKKKKGVVRGLENPLISRCSLVLHTDFFDTTLETFMSLVNTVRSIKHEYLWFYLGGRPILCWSTTSWYMRQEGPALRICPSHLNRRIRTCLMGLKLHEVFLTSWGMVFLVNWVSIPIFTPFIILFSNQVSHP